MRAWLWRTVLAIGVVAGTMAPAIAAEKKGPEGVYGDEWRTVTITHLRGDQYQVQPQEQPPEVMARKGRQLIRQDSNRTITLEFSEDWSQFRVFTFEKGDVFQRKAPPTLEEQARIKREEEARWRTAEVRANLRSAYIAQRAYHQEKDTYTTSVYLMGFWPERSNRYSYYFANEGASQNRSGAQLEVKEEMAIIEVDRFKYGWARFMPTADKTGCHITRIESLPGVGAVPGVQGSFLILAAGQHEKDGPFDCWTIASEHRRAPDGSGIPAGEPFQEPLLSAAQASPTR